MEKPLKICLTAASIRNCKVLLMNCFMSNNMELIKAHRLLSKMQEFMGFFIVRAIGGFLNGYKTNL